MSIRIAREVERIVGIGVICKRCRTTCACLFPFEHSLVQVFTGIRHMAGRRDVLVNDIQSVIRRTLDSFAPQFLYSKHLHNDLSALAANIVVDEARN